MVQLAHACCTLVQTDAGHLEAAACLLSLVQHEPATLGPLRAAAALALFLDVAPPWQAGCAREEGPTAMEVEGGQQGGWGQQQLQAAAQEGEERQLAHLLTLQGDAWGCLPAW